MRLNLPIIDQLANSQRILIAGAGGGFDVFCGLPLYFTLREMGKTVHLANYSFTEFSLLPVIAEPVTLIDNLLVGARGPVKMPFPYYPEGYLSRWFAEQRGEDVTVWMFARCGVTPLRDAYTRLVEHLGIDAIILVDGGVDSIMRGDENGAGTMVEDSITLAAVDGVDVPVKLLACVGFGTEVEEALCHYHALENIAALAKAGAFLGSCALTPQMEAFQRFDAACRYVWEQPSHARSHISTRIIPAALGEFGSYRLYPEDYSQAFISPLMSLYWFFDANGVIERNLLVGQIRYTSTNHEVLQVLMELRQIVPLRPRKPIPY
jgi:hypothetical protein